MTGSTLIKGIKNIVMHVTIRACYHGDSNQNTKWREGRVGGGAEKVKSKCPIIEGGNIWNISLPHNATTTTIKSIELKSIAIHVRFVDC